MSFIVARGWVAFALLLICYEDLFGLSVSATVQSKRDEESCPFTVKSYEGCYREPNSNPSFVPYDEDDPTISPITADKCACKCGNNGYEYSALINLNECRCGRSYANATSTTGCINKCTDNTTNLCGGFDDGDTSVYSIYKTTAGCDPMCTGNQTCQVFDNSFYMCVPSCEFSANFIYDIPCTDTALVYLNVTSSTFHETNFTYSLDGGEVISARYNSPIAFTFHVEVEHSFNISNRFGCNVTKTITLPAATVPSTNQAPSLTFDVSAMVLEAKYFKLLYPSETGNVALQNYAIDYRYKCPSDTNFATSWITLNNTNTDEETISVWFSYGLEYDVRVHSANCVGTSAVSDVTTSIAPDSPYVPTILSALPQAQIPTTGGVVTATGLYFTSSPTVYLDGSPISTSSVSSSEVVFSVGAGQGSHSIYVQSFGNYSCQEIMSSPFSWSYAAPSVTSSSVLSNAGGALVITGNNFGLKTAANVSVTIDGTPCSGCNVTSSHTTITCSQCPPGNGADHVLLVSVAGLSSSSFSFAYAECDPMCIFGECVGTNQCSCEDGYSGTDCSEVKICANEEDKTSYLGNTCGLCTSDSVCCQFAS